MYFEGLEKGDDIGNLLLEIPNFKNLDRGALLVAQAKSELDMDQYVGSSNFNKGRNWPGRMCKRKGVPLRGTEKEEPFRILRRKVRELGKQDF